MLHELVIEFEPTRLWTKQFLHSLQLSLKLAATCTRHRPCEADIARERNFLQQRVTFLCDRYKISQDRIWNLDETVVRIVPSGERLRFARLRHGHTCCKHERRHVDHSPAHWFAKDALLDTIAAIDADMHARPGDAELIPLAPGSGLCTTAHCDGISQHHARLPTAHQIVPRPAELHGVHSAAGPGVHARLQELDPPRGIAEFFLEVESNFEHVNLDSSTAVLRQLLFSFVHTAAQNADSPQHRNAGWRFIDWNEVEQRELLAEAKRLLETGELIPRGTAEEPHAPDAEAEAADRARGARDGAMSLLERLQAIRVICGSKPPT